MEQFIAEVGVELKRNEILVDSIMNFRPLINFGEKPPIYLNNQRSATLDSFLTYRVVVRYDSPGIIKIRLSTKQTNDRVKFLNNCIKITPPMFDGSWRLYSFPVVYSITFDEYMKYAIVYFKMVYSGKEAVMENKNGEWKVILTKQLWIE